MGQVFIGNRWFRLNQRHWTAGLSHNLHPPHGYRLPLNDRRKAINCSIYHRKLCIYHHVELTILTEDLSNNLDQCLVLFSSHGGESESGSDSEIIMPPTHWLSGVFHESLNPKRLRVGSFQYLIYEPHLPLSLDPGFLYTHPLSLVPIL